MPSQTLYLKDRHFDYIRKWINSKYRRLSERDREKRKSECVQNIIDDHKFLSELFEVEKPERLVETIEEQSERLQLFSLYIQQLSTQLEENNIKPVQPPEKEIHTSKEIMSILQAKPIKE